MVSIIPQPDPFSGGLAQSIGRAGQAFAQRSQKQRQQRQQGDALNTILNSLGIEIPEEQKSALGALPPNAQSALLSSLVTQQTQKQKASQQNEAYERFGNFLNQVSGGKNLPPGSNQVADPDNIDITPSTAQPPIKTENQSIKDQLNELDLIESQILQAGFDPSVSKQMLESIRSRRNSLSQQIRTEEKETSKLTAKRTDDLIREINSSADAAYTQLEGIETIKPIIESGLTGPSAKNALLKATEGLDGIGGAIHQFLITAEKQGLDTAKASFLPKMKTFFGGQVRVAEMNAFMDTLFQFGTDPKAQLFALEMWENAAKFDLAKQDIANNFIQDDGNPMPGFSKKYREEVGKLKKKNIENAKNLYQRMNLAGKETKITPAERRKVPSDRVIVQREDGTISTIPKSQVPAFLKSEKGKLL